MSQWSPTSWQAKPTRFQPAYPDAVAVERAVAKLHTLPPLVTSFEIERLKGYLAEAQEGRRFLLQGGDCAETLADCTPEIIANKLKILLQMSLVLVYGARKPVVRVGRFAGQYAKPRSSATETRQAGVGGRGSGGGEGDAPSDVSGATLPSYFGDLVNCSEFTPEARTPSPHLMVRCYQHAALTLNFIRSLIDAGFADLHHPEYWELGSLQGSGGSGRESGANPGTGVPGLSPALTPSPSGPSLPADPFAEYRSMVRSLGDAIRFMETIGGGTLDELSRVEFFTSHEGLVLLYEMAGTRTVPRREGYYDLTTHFPWIGERTRAVEGGHVEFFRGVCNPVGVKIGPACTADELLRLIETLNPDDEPGRVALIHRMGASRIDESLPPLLEAVKRSGRRVLWVCDPMHGNTVSVEASRLVPEPGRGRGRPGSLSGETIKTRDFGDILVELNHAFDLHEAHGTILGGVHFELTGDDVTECIGGARNLSAADLARNYRTQCDPRLNYEQSLEMAFLIARRLGDTAAAGR